MQKNIRLEDLNIAELTVLHGHLQLGIGHLQKHLDKDQLSQLLDSGEMESAQYQKIKADDLEKQGNIALMANTVFTSVTGGWLASISFVGISPATSKYILFFIMATAVISSGCFGYVSFKKVRTEAKDAVSKQKLVNLQLKLLSIIKQKKQHAIDQLIDYLNGVLDNFPNQKSPDVEIKTLNSFESKEEFVRWLNTLNDDVDAELAPLNKQAIYQIFIKRIRKIKTKLEKAIDTNIGLVKHGEEEGDESSKNGAWFSLEENKHKSFITILTDPAIAIPKAEVKKKPWLKTNIYSILNGLIPTMLGGFCSLFTYFIGLPDIAKAFGVQAIGPVLDSPITKMSAFLIIFTITLYFAYVSIHGNRKSFQREQEFEKTEKHIANKEAELLTITSRLNLFKKVKNYVEDILLILTFTRHISSNLKKDQF